MRVISAPVLKPELQTNCRRIMVLFDILSLYVLAFLRCTAAEETVQDAGMSVAWRESTKFQFALLIASIARRLVDLSTNSIGTMATIYSADHPTLSGKYHDIQVTVIYILIFEILH
jgi:hypothetical protein